MAMLIGSSSFGPAWHASGQGRERGFRAGPRDTGESYVSIEATDKHLGGKLPGGSSASVGSPGHPRPTVLRAMPCNDGEAYYKEPTLMEKQGKVTGASAKDTANHSRLEMFQRHDVTSSGRCQVFLISPAWRGATNYHQRVLSSASATKPPAHPAPSLALRAVENRPRSLCLVHRSSLYLPREHATETRSLGGPS
ncbi:hypothetical protein LZ30DRAFT_53776 [Colletotrichum cereale]|nr:hypothetical protein LZ30DRAFT_53776 [Colletotrichum cereale]